MTDTRRLPGKLLHGGFFLFLAAFLFPGAAAPGPAAAEIVGDLEWPAEWVIFAPAGLDAPEPPADQLESLPETLTVGERRIGARRVTPTGHQFDFGPLLGEDPLRQSAYVYLALNSPQAQEATLGFGADWWLKVFVNGDVVLDTTADGNFEWPPSITDNKVKVNLRQGDNIVAIRFLSGSGSSILAAGGPRELRAPLPPSLALDRLEREMEQARLEREARGVPGTGGLNPTRGWAERFRRDESEPERASVRLVADWADNSAAEAAVTFGVPFPRNALRAPGNARLLGTDGREVPAEFRPTATWDGPDGPVRWALVSARLTPGGEYRLEYGSAVSRREPDGLVVTEREDEIIINTGPAEFTLSRSVPSVVHAAALVSDGIREEIVTGAGSSADLPALVDGRGNVYRASGREMKVEVMERGPMRAAVRREGWYRGADGGGFCQFITYTYFQAGEAGFRHDHTLVIGFNTHEHTLREIKLPVPLNLGSERRAWFAADGSAGGSLIEKPAGSEPLSLVQADNDRWTLARGDTEEASGDRAGGWFGLSDRRWGAFAGIEHFWQNYPAELEVSGNTLNLHLYASRGVEPLDLRPSEILGRRGEPYPGDRVFAAGLYRHGLDEMTQGYGLGKTHSARFVFFREPGRAAAAASARLVNKPVIAYADPAWASATEAFGRVHHYDPERFPEIEAILDAIVHRRLWLRERLNNYGWIHFGDINGNMEHEGDPERVNYVDWRRWASMFYGNPNVMPLLFMRSGRRDAWDFHRVNTRHITDIDICHLDNDELRKWRGGRYGGNGGIVHFAAELYWIGCDTHLRFMLWDHYLNGNLRTREVADYYVEGHAAQTTHPSQNRYEGRHTGGALRFFTEAYEASWKPEYLAIMNQYAEILYGAEKELGATQYNDVYMNEGKIFHYQVTGDERMRDLFLNDMRVLSRERGVHALNDIRGNTMYGLSHAYLFTGDPEFLVFALWQLELARNLVVTEGDPGRVGFATITEYAYNATLANQLPTMMAALAEAGDDLPGHARFNVHPRGGQTRGALHLRQDSDGEIDLALDARIYTGIARPFANRGEWISRLPEEDRPVLVLIGPDGGEIMRLPLTRDGLFFLRHPSDGQAGIYTLQPASLATPLRLRLYSSNLDGFVLDPADGSISIETGSPLYFRVPAGTGEFSVRIKTTALSGSSRVEFFDSAGNEVIGEEVPGNRSWHTVALDAGRPAGDEAWSLRLSPGAETFLDFESLPGYVALEADALFDPDRRWSAPPAPGAPAGTEPSFHDDSGPGGLVAAAVPAGVHARVASPGAGTVLAGAGQGTLEMWLMCHRRPHEVQDRALLKLGGLWISRRAEIGTYAYTFGRALMLTGFVLPAGRWTHLALTWAPHGEGGVELTLFADGVLVDRARLEITGDWPGETLEIPAGEAGLSVAGVRVSRRILYEADFELTEKPSLLIDADTVVAWPVDERGAAYIHGQEALPR